jgi:hypothetical protein
MRRLAGASPRGGLWESPLSIDEHKRNVEKYMK